MSKIRLDGSPDRTQIGTKSAVVFDFDFTLADSSQGIYLCVDFALKVLGFATPADSEIRKTIGLTLPETFTRLTGLTDDDLVKGFVRAFHDEADRIMESGTTVYSVVPPLLRRLRMAGLKAAIVSTKLHFRLDSLLRANELRGQFDVIIGGDNVTRQKPDPEGLLLAARQLGQPLHTLVYVGDHTVDAEAAQRAKMPFIAVLSGNHSADSFESHPCRAILKDLSGLADVLGVP